MDIETLKGILERPRQAHRPTKLVIVIQRPGSIGGTPCVELEGVHEGFDWDSGKLMFYPAKPLTVLSPEDVAAIHESVRLGQSWHANQAHMKTAAQRRAAEAELASYKTDAERYRFVVAIGTNVALARCLDPLAIKAGIEHLSDPQTPESLATYTDNLMKIAIEAGLWPLKAEGDAA